MERGEINVPNITINLIPGLPKSHYANGYNGYIGVCAHSTGNPNNELAENEREFMVKNWANAFWHICADYEKILQCADIAYKAYGAGKEGNKRYVHIELAETSDPKKFEKAYANWIYAMAYVLFKKGLPVIDNRTLVSHDWVTKNLGGTDHTDPIGYLKKWGKTWGMVVQDVTKEYNKLKTPIVPSITIDKACEFICTKTHSIDIDYWKHQAKSVQYLDAMFLKISTKWMDVDVKNPVTKLPKKIDMTVEDSLHFIDSQIHLSDLPGWIVKSKNVKYLDVLFVKIGYVWMKDIIDDAET